MTLGVVQLATEDLSGIESQHRDLDGAIGTLGAQHVAVSGLSRPSVIGEILWTHYVTTAEAEYDVASFNPQIARRTTGTHSAHPNAGQILAGTPGLPLADRKDDESKQQREEHLDALIANAKKLLGDDYGWVHGFALNEQLGDGRDDLGEFGVRFDKWFSEQSLFDTGLVERAVTQLEKAGHIYVQDGAKWFRSTAFGDEKDRVVQRENGLYTYFASDIAYHLNKYERGFDRIIDIWGADHHGYIPRVKGAIAALGLWRAFDYVRTGGKGYNVSAGDGLFYSYSVYNDYRQIRAACRTVHQFNTVDAGLSLRDSAPHVALLGIKK